MNKFFVLIVSIILLAGTNTFGDDLRQIESLSGYWKFSVGDDMKWAQPDYDDSDWDRIKVPSTWEQQGYDDYNGYAWYRKTIEFEEQDFESQIYLLLGRIDDVNEVYINGELIGRNGSFPPNYRSEFSLQRSYRIPAEKLKVNQVYTIAVRVFDLHGVGGITDGRVGFYYDVDVKYIDFSLEGTWKFRTGRDRDWREPDYSDKDWDEVMVPASWESQGYKYDGHAYYRKSFKYTGDTDEELYLVLGRIDDTDRVFLNGEDLDDERTRKNYGNSRNDWRKMRFYKIPKNLLKRGTNQITVQVYDEHGQGGIYAGPVGITSEENFKILYRKHRDDDHDNVWEALFEWIID